MKSSGVLVFVIVATSLFRCKTEEIILHSNITGLVTDSTTTEPIQTASVKLNNTNDTTSTGSDGIYMFKNINPGNYDIQASKYTYAPYKKNVTVASAETKEIDFHLIGIATPKFSISFLDFGLDSTTLSFSISNIGEGNLTYVLAPSQSWITISPAYGNVTNGTDNITVTINKTGLSKSIYKETIRVISFAGQDLLPEITIPVYLNGVGDRYGNYYKVVKIGTQTWMAENLNVGTQIQLGNDQKNNNIIEKYCYNNASNYCDKYGGLYHWNEMMQYNPSDDKIIGTTQGICPDGWHIPTNNELDTLFVYLGSLGVAGGKLKETGTEHWSSPNLGATNESGFSGLPGGEIVVYTDISPNLICVNEGLKGVWWTSAGGTFYLLFDNTAAYFTDSVTHTSSDGSSVRCVKNPGK